MGNDWSSESVGITLRITDYIGKSYYTDKTKDPHRRNPKKFPYEDESKWIKYEMASYLIFCLLIINVSWNWQHATN